ncbi:MAG: glycosyl hydrolase [Planctomycetota bacterium]
MIEADPSLVPADLTPAIERMWGVSAGKILAVEQACPPDGPAPVFTAAGRYTARGWTEWTRGFQYGSAALQFEATGDSDMLNLARQRTRGDMAPHLTATGVHDHGFQNVSTYGNLWRLAKAGRFDATPEEIEVYETALRVSGAVQAMRWAKTDDGGGYVYSFNGPQSLFVDTLRSLRALAISHALGHELHGEQDAHISLLGRLIQHARSTARHNVWYGGSSPYLPEGELRDAYDLRGRTSHESIFNPNNGVFRCPSTQQGYSPFSTWTRGLAWAMLGFAEQLEFLDTRTDAELEPYGGRADVEAMMLSAAQATCDFYVEHTPPDGVPYWDTGAPGLASIPDWRDAPADPYNEHEPVDSSAGAIACQGLVRLGARLSQSKAAGAAESGGAYLSAGLKTLATLLGEPYLGTDADHQGLLLHSVYHRPNDWDYIPPGRSIPCGEACMWGDYHLREAALHVQHLAQGGTGYRFFEPAPRASVAGVSS